MKNINLYQTEQSMSKSPRQESTSDRSMDIFSFTQQTIYLFNQFMTQEYIHNHTVEDLYDNLARFYDGLIWAQKKNPLLVYQMFQMKALNQIVEKYIQIDTIVLIKNTVLLLGNCEIHGLVAQQIVEHRYPHFFIAHLFRENLISKYREEIAEYMGIFMKSYFKLFKIQWLNKFIIDGEYFQLLQINLKYHNCPDFMARTSSLNILLDLLKYKQVRKFIQQCKQRKSIYIEYFSRLTKQFRNELAEFGLRIAHISKQDNVDYTLTQLQDKIVLWVDLARNFRQDQSCVLSEPFFNNVILPLVIGPIQVMEVPLFKLKYALFVIKKLVSIMKDLHILQDFIKIIYINDKVQYYPSQLRKAIIQPFIFQKLASRQLIQIEKEQKLVHNNVKSFYQNFFKSKDNHFILMKNSLLFTLFKQGQESTSISKQYGLHYGGQLYQRICKNLVQQLQDLHQLTIIQSLLTTLILINNHKSLQTELQNQYIQIFKHLIQQLMHGLNNTKDTNMNKNINYLAQVVEHDVKIVDRIKLGHQKCQEKFEDIFKVVFVWEVKKQELSALQFYSRVPDQPTQYIRYLFVKFLLLKKARILLIDGSAVDGVLQRYYQLMVIQCPYIKGDLYKLGQLQQQLLQCCIVKQNQKQKQQAFIVKDKNFFVLCRAKQTRLQILHGTNYKHIYIEQTKKKKRMTIVAKQFNYFNKQLVIKNSFLLKWDENIFAYVRKMSKGCFDHNIAFIKECLSKTEDELPGMNLMG